MMRGGLHRSVSAVIRGLNHGKAAPALAGEVQVWGWLWLEELLKPLLKPCRSRRAERQQES